MLVSYSKALSKELLGKVRMLMAHPWYRATFPGFELTRQPAELQRYYSKEVPLPENNFRGGNRIRYVSPEFDGLLDRYFTTIPPRERARWVSGQILSVDGGPSSPKPPALAAPVTAALETTTPEGVPAVHA